MKPEMQLRLGQQLTLTPQLQQAIRLLQLSTLDLQTEIQQALESNMMLEAEEANNTSEQTSSSTTQLSANASSDNATNSTIQTTFDESYQTKVAIRGKRNDMPGDSFEHLHATKTTLRDHLYWQMELAPFTPRDKAIAMAIIDAIAEDGFLQCSLMDILESVYSNEPISLDEVEVVLHQIQNFDPCGVGARNLRECLLRQLQQLPSESPWRDQAMVVLKDHIALLGKRDYEKIMRLTTLSESDFNCVMQLIQKLNPRPGNAINPTQASYVIPDVIVRKQHGKWIAILNDVSMPKLRINTQYAGFIRHARDVADSTLLRNHLQEARWFIKSIQSRNETLLKVAECILEAQHAFFEYGEEAMKPMILQDVAQKVELHESTISRVTTQKYMHTPRGVFELKYFFSSHVSTRSGGECSSTAIRAFIKRFVAAEDRKKPLSDSKIADLLAIQGINVARRTVAKYRESLQIPPSNERKSWV